MLANAVKRAILYFSRISTGGGPKIRVTGTETEIVRDLSRESLQILDKKMSSSCTLRWRSVKAGSGSFLKR